VGSWETALLFFGFPKSTLGSKTGLSNIAHQGLPSGNQPGHYLGGATLNLGTPQTIYTSESAIQSWITLFDAAIGAVGKGFF
jgi:hypothetical protein